MKLAIPTIDSDEYPYCPMCYGSGKKTMTFCATTQGITETKITCYACNGTGKWENYKQWVINHLYRK